MMHRGSIGLGLCLGLGLALAARPAAGLTLRIGASAFGGASIPIVQDDNGIGSTYGVRVPVNLLSFLTLEPYFAHTTGGEAEETIGGIAYTRSGFDIDTFGITAGIGDLGLTPGFSFFPYIGLGSHNLSREGSDDENRFGFSLGVGAAWSLMQKLSLDARGELDVVLTDQTSRKFANLTLGLTYKFFGAPVVP